MLGNNFSHKFEISSAIHRIQAIWPSLNQTIVAYFLKKLSFVNLDVIFLDEHSLFYEVYILYISLSIYCYSIIHMFCCILIFCCYIHRYCQVNIMLKYSRLVIYCVTFSRPWIYHFFLPFSGISFLLLLKNFDSNSKIYLWHVSGSNLKYIKYSLFYIKNKVKRPMYCYFTMYSRIGTNKKWNTRKCKTSLT